MRIPKGVKLMETWCLSEFYDEEEDLEKHTLLLGDGNYLTVLPSGEWALWNDEEDKMKVFSSYKEALKYAQRRVKVR